MTAARYVRGVCLHTWNNVYLAYADTQKLEMNIQKGGEIKL